MCPFLAEIEVEAKNKNELNNPLRLNALLVVILAPDMLEIRSRALKTRVIA